MGDRTEDLNIYSENIASMNSYEIAKLIHMEDIRAYESIYPNIEKIGNISNLMIKAIKNGGRVIYIGAGTSGRLGAQDIVELIPTYGLGEESFDYIMAGGMEAMAKSIEGSEDSKEQSAKLLMEKNLNNKDIVIGISASGRTPFVSSGLEYAKRKGCITCGITNNENTELSGIVDICIELITGAEIIQGSTRMKAGTAQKMVLNMLSTITAVKLGKTLDNTMSNMGSWHNEKLKERAINILLFKFGISRNRSLELLEKNGFDISKAINEIKQNRKNM